LDDRIASIEGRALVVTTVTGKDAANEQTKEPVKCEGASCATDFSAAKRDTIFAGDLHDRAGSVPGAGRRSTIDRHPPRRDRTSW